jgi:hypothetical protein
MKPSALSAIQAVRVKRLQKAVQDLEHALAEGQSVSEVLLQVSGLLERGIDPRAIRSTFTDLPRLLEIARSIEAQLEANSQGDTKPPVRRTPV